MKKNELPPGQHEIPALLRWNIDHLGITDENPEFNPKEWRPIVNGDAPDKYGYKSAMRIERITFMKERKPGYWEKRGYSDTTDVWKNDRFVSPRRRIRNPNSS